MDENILNEIREIKKSFRLAMNGVVSTLQRRQGLDYKINFGVEIPRLKGIAAEHAKNRELATALWQDNIRECKMMAIFLMPEENYCDVAEKWIGETRFTEIADHLAMHLLCRMPNATEKALEWIETHEGMFPYCGFMTLSHLICHGIHLDMNQEHRLFESLCALTCSEESAITTRCALNTGIRYIENTPGSECRLKEHTSNKNPQPIIPQYILQDMEE